MLVILSVSEGSLPGLDYLVRVCKDALVAVTALDFKAYRSRLLPGRFSTVTDTKPYRGGISPI